MFGDRYGYVYTERQQQLFQRELPYKSIKLPVRKRETHILKYSQQKQQLQSLRLQILDRCKLEQMQYLQMLKKQREVMQADIRNRKKNFEINRIQEIIQQNKKINQRQQRKVQDSLDQLKKEEEQRQERVKSERAKSAYSSQMDSLNEVYVKTIRPSSKKSVNMLEQFKNQREIKEIKTQEIKKQDQIKKIKEEMMNKYRFHGEAGKKPKQVAEDKPLVDWWVKKVRDFRDEQKNEKVKDDEPSSQQQEESESDFNSEDSAPKKQKGRK